MSTISFECPHCKQIHAQDVAIGDDYSISRNGHEMICPFCRKTFRVQTVIPQTVHQQIDAYVDRMFSEVFHADPAAEAIAKAEYHRLAPSGNAIDPRD